MLEEFVGAVELILVIGVLVIAALLCERIFRLFYFYDFTKRKWVRK